MSKRRESPPRAMYMLVAVALVISLMITSTPPAALAASNNDVKVEWDRISTPTVDGWLLAPGSEILDYALAATGEVAYSVVRSSFTDCDDDLDPGTYDYLLKSEDHAATWTDITSSVKREIYRTEDLDYPNDPTPSFELLQVATDGNAPDFLAVALLMHGPTSTHVFFSADGGDTFSQIGGTLAAGFDVYTLAVSRVVNNTRNLAIGGTAGDVGVIYRATVVNTTPTNWVAAHTIDDDDDWEPCAAVVAVQFSPNFHADSTILAVTYHGVDGVFLQSGTWGTSILWNEPAGFADAVEVSDEAVDLGRFTAGLAVPSDYNGGNPGQRVLWVWVNYEEGTPAEPRNMIRRVDDADAGTAGPMSDIEGGKTWLASISYVGDIDSGKALAGLLSWDYATNGCPKVKVYRNHGISNMVICCLPWRSACKAPTGTGAMVVSYVAGTKAYAVAIDDSLAESAWSWTFDDGVNWNQLSLIDTNVDRLSDVAVSPDCNKTYLVSINMHSCDSVWLHAVNLPEATEYSGHWIRTWSRTLNGKHGILRLNPGETGGHTVYLAEVGGRRVFRDLYEGLGCWTMGTAPMDIADLAVKNATTVYALGEDGRVAKGTGDDFTIFWHSSVDSKLTNGWTIAAGGNDIITGGRHGDVSHSADGGVTFTRLADIPVEGLVTVAFDSYHGVNDTIYAAGSGSIDTGGIYRWVIGESTSWTDLGAGPHGYTGLVLDNPDGNPETCPATGGVLYASYVDDLDGQIVTGMARCATPAAVSCCSEDDWDYLTDGLSSNMAFVNMPRALKICGGLTAETGSRLFSIDSWNPYGMCEGEVGTVWTFAAGELTVSEDWLANLSLTTDPHIGTVPGPGYAFAFGARDGATEGYSEAEGDQAAPPDPIIGVNAYLYYPDNPMYQRNLVTSVVGPEPTITWPLRVKSVGDPGATEATLTWDAGGIGNVPDKYGVLELQDSAGNTLANMKLQDSYTFTLLSNETKTFHIVATEQVCLAYDFKAGWNMMSLPVHTEETSPGKLFPGHVVIYGWDAATLSYYVPEELVPGRGYWILYFSDTTVTICGTPVEEYELADAVAGWHLIGSLWADARVNLTAGSIYGMFYWWNPEIMSYEATDTLEPGKGYWLLGFTPFSIEVESRQQAVYIPDENLAAAIREAIDRPEGPIYPADLEGLTSLDASERSITDLTGLEYCASLTYLSLGNNHISDTSPLAGLIQLAHLYLQSNEISDLSPLMGLVNLTSLDLLRNHVENLCPLSRLTNLADLRISANPVTDISALANLRNLIWLSAGSNLITDISALSQLTGLRYLSLAYNDISDLSTLAGLVELEFLNLGSNNIRDDDLPPLADLTNLRSLWLWRNGISDLSPLTLLDNLTELDAGHNHISELSPLSALTNLTSLLLRHNQITDITPLQGLTNMNSLDLRGNQTAYIKPLVDNAGLGEGDHVDLRDNPLSEQSINEYIPALQTRGVTVCYDEDPGKVYLTISSTAGGSVTAPGEGAFSYEEGTMVDLVASPSSGYQFVNWTGDADTLGNPDSPVTTITMHGDYSITASFTEDEPDGFAGGSGTAEDPYQIATWHHLNNARNYLDAHFVLTDNLVSTTPGYDELAGPGANAGKGWQPIATFDKRFTGTFDGQLPNGRPWGIGELFINRPDESYVGLFGYLGAGGVIRNVRMGNTDVAGGDWAVGGLLGVNDGLVSDSYHLILSSVTGRMGVGGLVGVNYGSVTRSLATGDVAASEGDVGGLVGLNIGEVSQSYSTACVTGGSRVGGLVGSNAGTVSDSLSTAEYPPGGVIHDPPGGVTGDEYVGGLVGRNDGSVSNSYSRAGVTGDEFVGGLIGGNTGGNVSNSFWDLETSGQATSDGGTGKTTAEMQNVATFADANWDVTAVEYGETDEAYIWNIVLERTYPFLSWAGHPWIWV